MVDWNVGFVIISVLSITLDDILGCGLRCGFSIIYVLQLFTLTPLCHHKDTHHILILISEYKVCPIIRNTFALFPFTTKNITNGF